LANLAFFHFNEDKTNDLVLRTAISHAAALGNNVYLVSNDERYSTAGAKVIGISQFSDSIEKFRNAYVHLSPTRFDFEFYCFARWFAYRDMLKQLGSLYFLDRDILVYPGFEDALKLKRPNQMFDTAWFNHCNDASLLSRFCDYMMSVYETPGKLEETCKRIDDAGWNKNNGSPHVADMLLLYLFAEDNPSDFASLRQWVGARVGFDSNVSGAFGYETHLSDPDLMKKIFWDKDVPYVRRVKDGVYLRFRILHFQGHSKVLMNLYKNQDDGIEIPPHEKAFWWPVVSKDLGQGKTRLEVPASARKIDPLLERLNV